MTRGYGKELYTELLGYMQDWTKDQVISMHNFSKGVGEQHCEFLKVFFFLFVNPASVARGPFVVRQAP